MHDHMAGLCQDYFVGLGIGIMMGASALGAWAAHYWPKPAPKPLRNAKGQFSPKPVPQPVVEAYKPIYECRNDLVYREPGYPTKG